MMVKYLLEAWLANRFSSLSLSLLKMGKKTKRKQLKWKPKSKNNFFCRIDNGRKNRWMKMRQPNNGRFNWLSTFIKLINHKHTESLNYAHFYSIKSGISLSLSLFSTPLRFAYNSQLFQAKKSERKVWTTHINEKWPSQRNHNQILFFYFSQFSQFTIILSYPSLSWISWSNNFFRVLYFYIK